MLALPRFCLVAILLVQCSRQEGPPESGTSKPEPVDDYLFLIRSRQNEFDFNLVKAVLTGNDSTNVLLSPFAVKLMMALLAEAAGPGSVTERELASVQPSGGNILHTREFYNRVLRSLQEPSDNYDLRIASKMFVKSHVEPRHRFAYIAEQSYLTTIESVDFQAETTCPAINHWVAVATHNRITELVQPADLQDAVMVMLNAIYFSSDWRHPFPANETSDGPFFVRGNDQSVMTSFMHQIGEFFYVHSPTLDAKVLRLPYQGQRFSMTLVLPNNPDASIDELLARLDEDTLRSAQYYMDDVEVRIQIPKFRFEHSAPLNDVLQSLDIRSIFSEDASLSLLALGPDDQLRVSKVLQKAGIEMNERGSTAYAATELVLADRFGSGSTHEFIANRPFVFLIEDESTGSLLFAGKVCNPADFAAQD